MPFGRQARRLTIGGIAVAVIVAGAAFIASRGYAPGIFDSTPRQRPITYFIAPGDSATAYRESDRELVTWALRAWHEASRRRLVFEPVETTSARILIRWTGAADAYGRTRQLVDEDGVPHATVMVRADVNSLGPGVARVVREDPLMRELIIYLTCVHEIGHAIGLSHSDRFEDVMYDFARGGDIAAYFRRYRNRITTRDDLATMSVLSEGDEDALRTIR